MVVKKTFSWRYIKVIKVKKIILNGNEHLLYLCKKIKVLKINENFILNPSNLLHNSTKKKYKQKYKFFKS